MSCLSDWPSQTEPDTLKQQLKNNQDKKFMLLG